MNNLSFGVYYTNPDIEEVDSQYFYELQTEYPVTFTTNFLGIGLPSDLYSEMVTLLEYITAG